MNNKSIFVLILLLVFIISNYLVNSHKDNQYLLFYQTALSGPMEKFGCGAGGCGIKVKDYYFNHIDLKIGTITRRKISPGDFISKNAYSDTVVFKVGKVRIVTTAFKKFNWYTGE